MLIYLAVAFFITSSFYLLNKKYKKMLCIISFAILSFLGSFRSYNVGVDTQNYVFFFNEIATSPSWYSITTFEKGFVIFCKGLSLISTNPRILLIVSTIFINYCVVRFIYKNSSDPGLSFAIYILSTTYLQFFNIMRSAIAIAILLLFFESLKKGKIIRYIIGVIIALFFHTSSIIALAFIAIYYFKINKISIGLLVTVATLLFVLGPNVIFILTSLIDKYEIYQNTIHGQSNYFGALFQFVFYCCLLILSLFNSNILKSKNKKETILFYASLATVLFSFLTMRIVIMDRIVIMFYIYMLCFIPNAINMNKNKKMKNTLKIILTSFLLIYFIVVGTLRPEWTGSFPYIFM